MKYEVGKTYYRVRDNATIFPFKIDKLVRVPVNHPDYGPFKDTYYSKDIKVIEDWHTKSDKNDIIFEHKNDAIDYVIKELQKQKAEE